MANKIIHKHSSVITDNKAKLPTIEQLEYGELAINYADGVETITIKNDANKIVEFKSKKYFENIISDNEYVIASAITDIDERISKLNEFTDGVNEKLELTNVSAVDDETNDIDDVETNKYVKYVPQTLTEEEKEQTRENIGVNNVIITRDTNEEVEDVETNNYISFTSQFLTETEKLQARNNIGAASVNDIVPANWSETDEDSKSYIANKPNINTLSNSGIDLSDTINMYTNNAGGNIHLSVTNGQISLSYFYRDEQRLLTIDGTGNGTKFLANDGTYKEAVTKSEFDTTIGDINNILESIINGGVFVRTISDGGEDCTDIYNYLVNKYDIPEANKSNNALEISEKIYIDIPGDDGTNGQVKKVSFSSTWLLLWTETSYNTNNGTVMALREYDDGIYRIEEYVWN